MTSTRRSWPLVLVQTAPLSVCSSAPASRVAAGTRPRIADAPAPNALPDATKMRMIVNYEPEIVQVARDYSRAHDLSTQEERLLTCCLHGVCDKLAAEELGCSRNTIGTYWKRIFAKTGFRPQREVLADVVRRTFLTSSEIGRAARAGKQMTTDRGDLSSQGEHKQDFEE